MLPVIFETSIFTIYSLWFFVTIGFIVASILLYHLIKNSRLPLEFVTENASKLIVSSLILSRIFAVLGHLELYTQPRFIDESWWILKRMWNTISIWDKNLSLWGALVGFGIMFVYLAQKHKQELAKWADVLIISLISAVSIGNIGAYLDGIHYGKPTELPWGITYLSSSVKYAVPVHPTQIYAFLYTALVVGILYLLYRAYRNQYDGLVAYVGIFLYSFFRLLENFFRGDDALKIFNTRVSSIIFILIAVGSGLLVYQYTRSQNINIFRTLLKSWKLPFSKKQDASKE